MLRQYCSELPGERGLAVAVRRGNKIALNATPVRCIAELNLAELTFQNIPHSYLQATNDPKWGGSGPPPPDVEALWLHQWLANNCDVPDGLACWRDDPNPGPGGRRWTGWEEAASEYRRRTEQSDKQSKHIKPDARFRVHLKPRELEWNLTREFLISLYLYRIENKYDDKGRYLPPSSIKGGEHESPNGPATRTHQVEERAGPVDRRTKNDIAEAVKQEGLLQHHLQRLSMRTTKGEGNAPWIFSMLDAYDVSAGAECHLHRRIVVGIKPEHRKRYLELCDKRSALLMRQENVKDEVAAYCADNGIPLVVEEKDTEEIKQEHTTPDKDEDMLLFGELLNENPSQSHSHEQAAVDTESSEEMAAEKETVMSPSEEQSPQSELVGPPHWHECTEYGEHLKFIGERNLYPRMHNQWVTLALKTRRSEWKKRGIISGKTSLTQLYLAGLGDGKTSQPTETPPKRETYDKPSSLEALVYSGGRDPLVVKQDEIRDYLSSVGGLGTFKLNEKGILVPPGISFDEELPWD